MRRHRTWAACRVIGVALMALGMVAGCGSSGGSESQEGTTWTVMVYLDGDNNLEADALTDFNEMEAAAASPDTRVIVLFDRSSGYTRDQGDWAETRLYEIYHDTDTSAIASKRLTDTTWLGLYGDGDDELNMGSAETLRRFIAYGRATYPAEHTALILWDHGSGWAPSASDAAAPGTKFIATDETSAGDALSVKEVALALEGQGVNLLGFDACLMAELEVAWEFQRVARFMVASEGLEPSSGWDYTGFLTCFSQLPSASKSPEALGRCIAETYMESRVGGMDLGLSVVDLAALSPLGAAVDELASEMTALSTNAVITARYLNAAHYNADTCVDLRQFAEVLGASAETRNALGEALSDAVIYNEATRPELACGLSIYFPVFGVTSGQYSLYTSSHLSFVADTQWDEALDHHSRVADWAAFIAAHP
ncbi:clostripain-related cysteine peptidase [Desulfoluna spongiiphila]|uniref:clostripain-related cysteine peptidase n=1 Tax=Desulfoluna spongiiphila TaxID=419481 RepID=UPI00125AFBDA|nr:clostripain-related cysteine peptidase [Desulfoluna spongiiphila]VVS94368.1 peptidase c11 clostripain [Desulfoluna spongiiphila]